MKRMWWIAGAGLVAVALVVGTLALAPKKPGGSSKTAEPPTASRPASSAPVAQSGAATDAPAPSASPTAPPQSARPDDPASQNDAAESAPKRPLEPKTALPEINAPPSRTLAMIQSTAASAGKYSITFRPYGTGPRQASQTVVIRIDTAEPSSPVKKVFAFEGRNALVNVTGQAFSAVRSGGSYRGTLELRRQDDLLVLWLDDVARKNGE